MNNNNNNTDNNNTDNTKQEQYKPLPPSIHIETHAPFQISFKKRSTTDMIVVHCAATQPKKDIDWRTIDAMHRQRNFIAIGYHYVITVDGVIQEGRPEDAIGAHAKDYNSHSIGICLVGGINKEGKSTNNFTDKQMASLDELVSYLLYKYPTITKVLGHRDLPNVAKDCPCFDVIPRYSKLLRQVQNQREQYNLNS